MDNTRPPVVSTRPSVVPILERVTLASLITVTDLDDNSSVSRYRFRDNTTGAGNFLIGEQFVAANQWQNIAASQFASVTYRGGTQFARETFSVQVYDGRFWSNVSTNSITTGNVSPVVTATAGRVAESERVRIDQFLTVTDGDGDSALRYLFVDRRNNFDGGRFVDVNGAKPQATWFIVEAGDLAGLYYEGAVAGRDVENIGVQVWDGYSWSATTEFEMATTTRPNVVPTTETILVDQRRSAVAFFNTTDGDGDKIFSYNVNDYSTGATSGYWEFKGVRKASGQFFTVKATELGQLFFIGASTGPQSDTVGVQVYDGFQFSSVERIEIKTVTPPEVSGRLTAVQAGHYINMANGKTKNAIDGVLSATGTPILDYQDADGDLVDSFLFNDRSINANGGHFVFKGVKIASGQFFQVLASELDQLYYRGGEFGPQGENVQVLASSSGVWSDTATFRVNTLENRFAPVLNLYDVTAKNGTVMNVSGLFTSSDADGDAIQSFSFYDTGDELTSGFFSVNGVVQPAKTWITLDWDELPTVKYHLSNLAGTENIRMRLSDGRKVSTIETTEIISVAKPIIDASVNDISLDTIERLPVSSLVTQQDSGPSFIQYQVYDENDFFRSGRLELDGVDLQQGVVHTLTAAEYNRLVFKGAEVDFGRQLDPMLVRGDNGITGWTEWERVNVNTDPVGADALTSGTQWTSSNPGTKTIVPFMFIDGNNTGSNKPPVPTYYTCIPAADPDEECNEAGEGKALNQPQRETIREILRYYETVGNIEFREVGTTQDARTASLTFGAANLPAGVGAWAYYPNGAVENGFTAKPGDVWFDTDAGNFDPDVNFNVGLGSSFRFTAYHEIGHAIGFKHPFDGLPVLSIFQDFDYNTVMSYSHDSVHNPLGGNGGYFEQPSSAMLYDNVELQRLYGANATFNTNNNHYGNLFSGSQPYFFNNYEQHQTSLWDAGGIDTLNYTNHTGLRIIDGRLDMNGDGVVDGNDDGNVRGRIGNQTVSSLVQVIDGRIDLNGDTTIAPDDDGTFKRINIIDGEFDLNGNGAVSVGENGFLSVDETIDLREGTWSSINGVQQSLRIQYGTVIENARGGTGDDNIRGNEIANLLFGNAGNDVLRGGGDNDVLRGGAGDDTYIWSLGDGRDNIREEGKGGIDMVQFFDPSGAIDSLEDDFTVRRFGSELRIDLTLDQGEGQGTVSIINFQDPNSSVELMRIHGLLGAKIGNDIDLVSLFNIATSAPTQYKVTDQVGLNGGYIAAPLT